MTAAGAATAGSPTAATISVAQTLAILDAGFRELAEGLAQRRYGVWLGSGISRESVDDLKALIIRVLKYLRDNADFTDANSSYVRAIHEALDIAQLSDADRVGFDPSQPFADWKPLPTIVDRLRNSYARLLDIRLDGKTPDHLLWDIVDVPATFAAAGVEPDCEHYCIAILLIEGVIADIASANWDGLIEKATDQLTEGATDVLRVCVRPDDFREPPLRARLLKFHGCAVRATADPGSYRALLVGRESQITDWPRVADTAMMRQQLVGLATQSPTLMVGLSAQDSNIKDIFVQAKETMGWAWPAHPPAYVFAEELLGADQRALLKCVYRQHYDAHPQDIEQSAQVRAFAKPLLAAMVLEILHRKLAAFLRLANAPHFGHADYQSLETGLQRLRDRLAVAAEPDRRVFIRSFIEEVSRGLDLFREGRQHRVAFSYRPLGLLPTNQIAVDPTVSTSGVPELAAALGALGLGEASGDWTIDRADAASPTSGTLLVKPKGAATAQKIFLAANVEAGLQLHVSGAVRDDEPDVVVIYSTAPPDRLPRSPRAAPGRTGLVATRVVGIRPLLSGAATLPEFLKRFREEAVL